MMRLLVLLQKQDKNLIEVRPLSIAQASRISGVNPADISILLIYIEQGKIAKIHCGSLK